MRCTTPYTPCDSFYLVSMLSWMWIDSCDLVVNPIHALRPSGGDWGLYRGGAIFVEGAEDVTIQHNTLTRLDGNAVFVSGYGTFWPDSGPVLAITTPLTVLYFDLAVRGHT